MQRFRDGLECLCVFVEHDVHVVCPRCAGPAVCAPTGRTARPSLCRLHRIVCRGCAYTADHRLTFPGPRPHVTDGSFGAELWLRQPCAGHVLWVLNEPHLDVLERFVAADQRERGPIPCSLSMIESLPAWMQYAGHRTRVLRGLGRLRARLPRTGSGGTVGGAP